jgi:WhiB family redox-sensing transcriptional regulator
MSADMEWMKDRACTEDNIDPEAFFANNATVESMELAAFAKGLCFDCPVRDACLTYALENKVEFGIWGGLDEFERRSLLAPGQSYPRRAKPPTTHERCGRYSGVSRHRRRDEYLCEPCTEARSVYERNLKAAKRAALREVS